MSSQIIPESKSGMLMKQSRGEVRMMNWRKRYVVLEAGKLSYFVGSKVQNGITTGVELKGELILEHAKVFKGSGSAYKLINSICDRQLYVVAGTDELNLFLEAPTTVEAAAWVLALEQHAMFATTHPSMVPASAAPLLNPAWAEEEHLEARSGLVDSSPEYHRFNTSVLKTTIIPTLYGILIKTRDESTHVAVFVSVVSHPFCHDSALSNSILPSPSPMVLVNPRCWYFQRRENHCRRTASKLGLREYCEPSLAADGEPYVVLQLLVCVDAFHMLLQEIHCQRARQASLPTTVFVNPQSSDLAELQKVYVTIAAALAESHQIACHPQFSVVHFEEQEYQPFFVSPMEIVIGRNRKDKRVVLLTTLENIQRHTEVVEAVPGVQFSICGQGVVPPSTVRSTVNIIIKLHSHAVCDEMRGLQLSLASESNIAATSPLKGSAQTSLDHALEECTQAVFLVGEAVHRTGKNGEKYFTYDITTNTAVVRICKLDQFVRKQQQRRCSTVENSDSDSEDEGEEGGGRNRRFSARDGASCGSGPGVTDIVAMHLLQALGRYFDVKISGYSASMGEFDDSMLSATCDSTQHRMNVIKFSGNTRRAAPLFSKENVISNDDDEQDSVLAVCDITFDDDEDEKFTLHQRQRQRQRPGNQAPGGSSPTRTSDAERISILAGDIIYTDSEFYSCKLKEMTSKGADILNALEDELQVVSSLEYEHNASKQLLSFKCAKYQVSAAVPIFVLDHPVVPLRGSDQSRDCGSDKTSAIEGGRIVGSTGGGLAATAPSVTAEVRRWDTVSVYCVMVLKDSSRWLLIDSGWIPGTSSKLSGEISDAFPCTVMLRRSICEQQQGGGGGEAGEGGTREEAVWVDCSFEATRCRGKSAPFRRHFKNYSSSMSSGSTAGSAIGGGGSSSGAKAGEVLDPFSYDKSANYYDSVPVMRLRRQRVSIDQVVSDLLALGSPSLSCESQCAGSLLKAQQCMNSFLEATSLQHEAARLILKEFLTPTEDDKDATEHLFLHYAW